MDDRKLGQIPHPDTEIKEKIFSEDQLRKYDQIMQEEDLMPEDQWRRFRAYSQEPVKINTEALDRFHAKLEKIAKTFHGPEKKSLDEVLEMLKKGEL